MAQRVDRSGHGALVRLKPDLVLPRDLILEIPPRADDPYGLTFRATWDPLSLRYELTHLEIAKNAAAITSAGLRAIAVQEEFELMAVLDAHFADGQRFSLPMSPTQVAPGDRVLWAARVYAMSRAVRRPPLQSVADSLGVSQSTATRLVARARSEGLLDG